MRYQKLGLTDIDISVVALGAWAIGGDSNWGSSDDDESIRTLHKARDLGINLIDTAPAYGLGHSEEVVGKALKGMRSDYILSTKCGLVWDGSEGSFKMTRDGVTLRVNLSPLSIRKQLEASLRRLNTDYIDLYITHWQATEPFKTPIEDTLLELNRLVQEGKIRAIGISNVTADELDQYCQFGRISLVQQKFSLLDRTYEATILPRCEARKITFQAYSPLERGILTGTVQPETLIVGNAKRQSPWFQPEQLKKVLAVLDQFRPICDRYHCTMTNLVIAWTASRMDHMNVLCGARKVGQVEENACGADIVLETRDREIMNEAAAAILP